MRMCPWPHGESRTLFAPGNVLCRKIPTPTVLGDKCSSRTREGLSFLVHNYITGQSGDLPSGWEGIRERVKHVCRRRIPRRN